MSIIEMNEDLNYACKLKETSDMRSNKYKNIYEYLAQLTVKAYEKGIINVDAVEKNRRMLPTNSKIFAGEHSMNFNGIADELDRTLNDAKLATLVEYDYTPEVKSKVA